MTPEQIQPLLHSIENTLDRLNSPDQINIVNQRLEELLAQLGPQTCDTVNDPKTLNHAYEIWRRLFRPKQLGTKSPLCTTPNSTKLIFIRYGFFLDIGSNTDRNILLLAYGTLNKCALSNFLAQIKNTPLYAKILKSNFGGKNIIEHIFFHLQERTDEIMDMHYNSRDIKPGSIHKTRQGISFAIELIEESREILLEAQYRSYITQLQNMSTIMDDVSPKGKKGMKRSTLGNYESTAAQPDTASDAAAAGVTSVNDELSTRNINEDSEQEETILVGGEISPAKKQAVINHDGMGKTFSLPPSTTQQLPESEQKQLWGSYKWSLSKHEEHTSLEEEDLMEVEVADPLLQPAEYQILPTLPLGSNMLFAPLFSSTCRLPDLSQAVLDQIMEQGLDESDPRLTL